MITAAGNSRIKRLVQLNQKAKARRMEDVFVVEGAKMFLEAPAALIQEVYISESVFNRIQEKNLQDVRLQECKKKLDETGFEVVTDELFKKISDTQTPQGILCVVSQYHYELDALLEKENAFFMVLEDIQDPGNLGTIMRTGEGAGIDGVIMSKNTVDLYNPKTIRSTMGSIYRVPFVYVEDMQDTLQKLKKAGVHTYAAHLDGKHSYTQENYCEKTAFLIGNEGNGLKEETAKAADTYIRIPMDGQVESLNAAIAAALLMYEGRRQRKG
ncbi:MAG: 23S rRNA (guanosine(2251)-2'-O)-methyltransferase RlmB [Lachnospiraceae bacterium]|nr:23S rRNA (guanosine(2251)-2'-O)-methyltransferase RlmB [Lachnospiraceae bacterium]